MMDDKEINVWRRIDCNIKPSTKIMIQGDELNVNKRAFFTYSVFVAALRLSNLIVEECFNIKVN